MPDKGAVEGMVGFSRRTFMVPIPRFADIDALNAHLLEQCLARQTEVLRGTEGASIADRLAADQTAFMDLPATRFDACHKRGGRASSQALVRYRKPTTRSRRPMRIATWWSGPMSTRS